jgi:hypothetical protein
MIAGIWILALSFGIIGYQSLTYYFYGYWPPVTVAFIWTHLFGPWAASDVGWVDRAEQWYGNTSLFATGVALTYLCFLLADVSRRR